jgi:phosphomannomutase
MAGELARYSHSGELRYEMPSPEAAAKAIEELAAQFRDADIEKVDGLTVRLADWWFNLRQPGGSTSLRLCVEGRSNADLRRGTMAIERAINKHLQQKPS